MGSLDGDDDSEASYTSRSPDQAIVTVNRPSAPASTPARPPPLSRKPSANAPGVKPPKSNTEVPVDPNLVNTRLLVNRACIYERHLPGDAYITAHVQRLQHGYYSSKAVSDQDFDHVDFLGINFVFHSTNTQSHRFKAATIRASVRGTREPSSSSATSPERNARGSRSRNPRFLKHAPHLLYGAVSPETLQWNYSLAGTLGVAEMPLMASISPSGGMNGRYRRYEMMRVQGSVRSLKSPRGRKFDVEAGEVVWSLEENTLQRSGLPREFTFALLIQKPRAESRVYFGLEIDPVLQAWYGNYPSWWLSLSPYQPVPRRAIDFRVESGQRFEPSSPEKGFNFATLESSFDDYVHMPGRKFTSSISTEGAGRGDDDNEIRREVTRDFTMTQPIQGMPQLPYTAIPGQMPGVSAMPGFPGKVAVNQMAVMPGVDPNALSVRVLLDNNNGNNGISNTTNSMQYGTEYSVFKTGGNNARDGGQGGSYTVTRTRSRKP